MRRGNEKSVQQRLLMLSEQLMGATFPSDVVYLGLACLIELLPADHHLAWVTEEREDVLRLAAASGALKKETGTLTASLSTSGSGWAIRHRRPVVVNDLSSEKRFVMPLLHHHGAHTAVVVPLLPGRDRALGTLVAAWNSPVSLDDETLELVTLVANLTAVALERARLFTSTQEQWVQEQGVLLRLSEALLGTLDVGEVANRVVDCIVGSLEAQMVICALYDEVSKSMVVRAGHGWGDEVLGLAYPIPTECAMVKFLTGSLADFPPACGQCVAPLMGRPEDGVGAVVHMVAMDKLKGVIAVRRPKGRCFTDQEQRLLSLIANQAAIALDRAQLNEETQQHLARVQRLNAVAAHINRELDLNELLPVVVSLARDLLVADAGFIAFWDQETTTMTYRYISEDLPINLVSLKVGCKRGLARQAALCGRTQVVRDYAAYPMAIPAFVEAGVQGALCTPLQTGEQVLGVLGLLDLKGRRAFSAVDREVAENVARQAAVAVRNARLVEALRRSEAEFRELSIRDKLTGVYNRLFFEEELQRLERGRVWPVSIILGDVDGLKAVNDSLGHTQGDELLRDAANLIQTTCRAGDVVARVGGDEFAIVLAGADEDTAKERCRLLAEAVAPISISFGYATADDGYTSLGEVLKKADAEMYRVKAARGVRCPPCVISRLVDAVRGGRELNGTEARRLLEFLVAERGGLDPRQVRLFEAEDR